MSAPGRLACPLCGASETAETLCVPDFPYFTAPLARAHKREIITAHGHQRLCADLEVRACLACSHCFTVKTEAAPLADLYAKFHSYPSALQSGFAPKRDDAFLDYFLGSLVPARAPGPRVLEVACYDGYILKRLERHGFSVRGCDPSPGALIGREQGLTIDRRFFDAADYQRRAMAFDIVLCRHFIEHVDDPADLVREMATLLAPDGMLVLETPDAGFHLERGLAEVFSHQHLNVFSAASLGRTAGAAGLRVLRLDRVGANLVLTAGRGPLTVCDDADFVPALLAFQKRLEENRRIVQQAMAMAADKGERVALWGAGSFGMAAMRLYGIPPSRLSYIIDSDPAKWEMEYIDQDTPIISPKKALADPPDLVVVASMYAPDILARIQGLGLRAATLCLYPDVRLRAPDQSTP